MSYDSGGACLTCDQCGRRFDPLVCDWKCPHCGLTWPWRFIRRMPAMKPKSNVRRLPAVRVRPERRESA
jgi:PHP family Zn ribbon phosphoesterase